MMRDCRKNQRSADYQPLAVPTGVRSRRLVTVEPALGFYMLAQGFIIALQAEYVQGWVSRIHNYTLPNNGENGTCSINKSSSESVLEDKIQAESSRWLMYLTIANALPSLFTTLIFASCSDSVGRRFALLLPSFGQLLNMCVWILTARYALPLEYLIGSMFLRGLMGSSTLFITSCFIYISDITTKNNRTTRIIIGECVLLSTTGISQLCAGYVLHKYDFVVAFAVAAGLSGMAFIYLALPFILLETVVNKGNVISALKTSLRGILILTFKKNVAYRKTFYILNFIMFTVFMFSNSTVSLLSIYFLGEPFCFSYLVSGYYTTVLLFTPAIGRHPFIFS
ncbi:solute carrier family 46 member 3-like [Anneissia japonica]|uniref:solute carrier family 46 member 3-like n=1 Tax=Anneissia japonica TaxID=1529436 RepID=UPI001425733F|nr:solute carrier family 46 member 3-like [Anneissia japonica]